MGLLRLVIAVPDVVVTVGNSVKVTWRQNNLEVSRSINRKFLSTSVVGEGVYAVMLLVEALRGADKSLARPGRKQATETKL